MTRVLLVGAMATGKSTVGRALAELLGCDHLDNDDLLLEQTGATARVLAERDGEQVLRAAESDVLRSVLARPAPWVAGAAAGVVTDPADRDLVRTSGAIVVWLAAPAEVLAGRVDDSGHRPWLGDDAQAALERLVAERAPFYAELAVEVVDVSEVDPQTVAEQLAARLG